ncbi:MAG: glycine cleavage system protein H [Deltaproteobacteria bacterium]|nr:glycine cleavage system protein H [Deltaproteobacteria bacterium]
MIKDRLKGKKRVQGFQVVEQECIWMKAGVVNFRKCDNNFDCSTCPFDKAMQKAMGIVGEVDSATIAPQWVDHLRKTYAGHARPCRHALTGRVEAPKICTMSYECYHCPFDQALDDADYIEDAPAPSYNLASGYKMADGYYYHMGHSWTRFEHGGRVRIGFDDFLVKVFGLPETLMLPPLGANLKQNEVGLKFGREDHEAAILAPVTGTVLAVNHRALEHPDITHEDPYNEGWLCIMEPDMPKRNLKGLYFGKEGSRWMEQEAHRLLGLMGPEYENLAATGGEPIGDVYGNFPEIGWDVLSHAFLRTEKV